MTLALDQPTFEIAGLRVAVLKISCLFFFKLKIVSVCQLVIGNTIFFVVYSLFCQRQKASASQNERFSCVSVRSLTVWMEGFGRDLFGALYNVRNLPYL